MTSLPVFLLTFDGIAGVLDQRGREDLTVPVHLLQLQRSGVLRASAGAETGHRSDPERLLQPLRTSPLQRPDPHVAEPRQVSGATVSSQVETQT